MLDSLAADRKRIETLGAQLAFGTEEDGSQVSRLWRRASAAGITHEIFNSSDAG
jgi:hypothetical protein